VLLLGDRSVTPEAFPLTVPSEVDRRAGEAAPPSAEAALRGSRGLGLRLKPGPAPAAPEPGTAGPTVPLRLSVARTLVEEYLRRASDPDFQPTRGLGIRPRNPDEPVPAQRVELPADVFVPPALRQRLRRLRPERLVVVPDGPLHKLPLEALPVEGGARPRYLLDELPPTVYAPSVAALGLLADRPRRAPRPRCRS
jgi:hypothetical protein